MTKKAVSASTFSSRLTTLASSLWSASSTFLTDCLKAFKSAITSECNTETTPRPMAGFVDFKKGKATMYIAVRLNDKSSHPENLATYINSLEIGHFHATTRWGDMDNWIKADLERRPNHRWAVFEQISFADIPVPTVQYVQVKGR